MASNIFSENFEAPQSDSNPWNMNGSSDSDEPCGEEEAMEPTQEDPCRIFKLPDELMLYIFSFFDVVLLSLSIAPVCRKWRSLAHDPCLWKSLRFTTCRNEERIMKVIEKSPYVTSLFIESLTVSNEALNKIGLSLKYLSSLTMRFCEILDEGALSAMARRCSNLQDVNIEGSKFGSSDSINAFSDMVQLKHLNMSHCHIIDNQTLVGIAKNCSQLETINIDGITSIYDFPVAALVEHRSKTLKNLILDGELLTDASFCKLDACKNLEQLFISFCDEMTDISILRISKLSKLKLLKLRKGPRLTATILASLFSNKALCNLSYLNLGECPLIDDTTLESIAKNCLLLQSLGLQWCWEVTDLGMKPIADSCEKLRILDLVGIVRLTGSCFLGLETSLPDLRVLDLEQCSNIDDAILQHLCQVRPEVKIFDYWGDIVQPLS